MYYQRDIRSIVTSDGDVLHISIRTFSELLLSRFSLPSPTHPEALLSRHSASIFSQMTEILSTLPQGPRDPAFDRLLLPHSERVLLAFGHAFAYSAALDSGAPFLILSASLFHPMSLAVSPPLPASSRPSCGVGVSFLLLAATCFGGV